MEESRTESKPSRTRSTLIGFVILAALPVGYGAYMLLNQGSTNCGMGGVAGMALIFVGLLCGMVGAILGFISAADFSTWK